MAPITALYAGLHALLLLGLVAPIVLARYRHGVGIGDGGHGDLQRAIRVHGNAVEYVPTVLILLLLFEMNGGPGWAAHLAGAGFFVSRCAHAWGLSHSSGRTLGRALGTLGTWLILVALALADIGLGLVG